MNKNMDKQTIKKLEALIAKYDRMMKVANEKMRQVKAEVKKIKAAAAKKAKR